MLMPQNPLVDVPDAGREPLCGTFAVRSGIGDPGHCGIDGDALLDADRPDDLPGESFPVDLLVALGKPDDLDLVDAVPVGLDATGAVAQRTCGTIGGEVPDPAGHVPE